MTISAFFMNRTFYYLNITIRVLIIAAGLFIEFNWMRLTPEQHDSILWIGRLMIVFGILRLAWLIYQVKFQHKDEEVRE